MCLKSKYNQTKGALIQHFVNDFVNFINYLHQNVGFQPLSEIRYFYCKNFENVIVKSTFGTKQIPRKKLQ